MKRSNMSLRTRQKQNWGRIFVLPCFLIIAIFVAYPLCYTFYLSLCEYNFAFDLAPKFVGLKNYIDMFQDSKFLVALKHTLSFAVVDFILLMIVPLVLALILFFKGKNTSLFRTAIFVPIVVPASLICIVFTWMFAKDYGIINQFLIDVLHMPYLAKSWLTSKDTAMGCLIVVSLWCNIGFSVMLYLAGLQAISPDILEAADVDGATGLRKIGSIILPNLKQTYILTGINATVTALKVFVEPSVMTNGGPGTATIVLYQYIYSTAFKYFDLGYASAMAFLLSTLILIVSMINFMLNSRKD